MDFWDDTTMRLYVSMQHRERIAQGDMARRAATLLDRRAARTRVAAIFVALAMRLDPALRARERETPVSATT